jgi:putative NADH-flavin reductase
MRLRYDTSMQITVFGASGMVGSRVVARLLEEGYFVVAFVHSSNRLQPNQKLNIVQGDIHDRQAVAKAIKGSDAVISALGSWGTTAKDILTAGMKNIVLVMESANISRVISLTGADARAAGDSLSLLHRFTHFGLGLVGRKVLRDGEKHIALLQTSKLDWTVIRSPIMNDRGSLSYYLSNKRPLPWRTVNRQSVAKALVDQLENKKHLQDSPFISRG